MEPTCSLPSSQQPATGLYPETYAGCTLTDLLSKRILLTLFSLYGRLPTSLSLTLTHPHTHTHTHTHASPFITNQ